MDWDKVTPPAALSLPDRVSIDIERFILEGQLEPGSKLPAERELAAHFGVSRVSIREALSELENRGLIDRKPGRGTIVLDPSRVTENMNLVFGIPVPASSELSHIMELRAIIEPPIAKITASRANARDIEQLTQLVEAMEQDPPKEKYAELDRAFHQAIALYTHNPLLAIINEQIAKNIAPSRADRYQTAERRRISSKSHRRILQAIAKGDGDLAEYEAREHVNDISRQIFSDKNDTK